MICAEIERCAGIDVGKERLSVSVMVGPLAGEPRVEYREFGTITAELEHLRQWLQAEGVTHVVMESTGSYWKPVFNVLEDSVRVYLANPQDVKNRKGHKTDKKDSWWLAHLLRHAMIRPSFVPSRGLRELRDLTRRRGKMIGVGTSERNRVDKMLQDANVKLSSALSDIFGVSGQLMLEALLEGKAQPAEIAQFAKNRAQRKIPQIVAALEGHRMSDHHRQMIRYSLEHLRFLEQHILELDEQIVAKIEALGYTPQWQLLQTVPGLKENSAASVLAEIGPDMGQFGSEKKLSSCQFLDALRRLDKDHIRAGLLVSLAAAQGLVQAKGGPRIGPGDDHEVIVLTRIGRSLNLLDHFLHRNDLPAQHVAAPLRENLILKLDGRDPCFLIFTDGAPNVERIAVARIAVGQNRHIDGIRDIAGMARHFAHGQKPDIGLPEDARRSPVAGHVDGLEPRHFDDPCTEHVVGAWRDQQRLVGEQLLQTGRLSHGCVPLVADNQSPRTSGDTLMREAPSSGAFPRPTYESFRMGVKWTAFFVLGL